MLHVENGEVKAAPVNVIEGDPTDGTFFVKPLMRGNSMALMEVRVEAGTTSRMHAHSHESLIYVVSGRLSSTIGAETFIMNAGDVCRHPEATQHQVTALQDSVFVEIKSPAPDLGSVLGFRSQ